MFLVWRQYLITNRLVRSLQAIIIYRGALLLIHLRIDNVNSLYCLSDEVFVGGKLYRFGM